MMMKNNKWLHGQSRLGPRRLVWIAPALMMMMISLQGGADHEITVHVISTDGYKWVLDIVSYHQMELRRPIRLKLLELLTMMCVIDTKVRSDLRFPQEVMIVIRIKPIPRLKCRHHPFHLKKV